MTGCRRGPWTIRVVDAGKDQDGIGLRLPRIGTNGAATVAPHEHDVAVGGFPQGNPIHPAIVGPVASLDVQSSLAGYGSQREDLDIDHGFARVVSDRTGDSRALRVRRCLGSQRTCAPRAGHAQGRKQQEAAPQTDEDAQDGFLYHPHGRRSPTTQRCASVLTKSWPCETAIELRQ